MTLPVKKRNDLMKSIWRTMGLTCAAIAAIWGLPLCLTNAADDASSASDMAAQPPSDLFDPAFDQYVDMGLLADAWAELDPALMTDVALQLAEGERILMRSHKAVSATQMMRLAAKLAAEKGNKEVLGRIGAAAGKLGDKDLAAEAKGSAKLASSSRKASSDFQVDVESLTPEQYDNVRGMLLAIQAARVASDQEGLGEMVADVDSLGGLNEKQREHLKSMISTSQKQIEGAGKPDDSAMAAARKLNDVSRQIKIGVGGGYVGHFGGGSGGSRHGYHCGRSGGYQGGYYGGYQGGYRGGYQGGHYGGHQGGYYGGHQGGHYGGNRGGYYGGHQGGHYGGHSSAPQPANRR